MTRPVPTEPEATTHVLLELALLAARLQRRG